MLCYLLYKINALLWGSTFVSKVQISMSDGLIHLKINHQRMLRNVLYKTLMCISLVKCGSYS